MKRLRSSRGGWDMSRFNGVIFYAKSNVLEAAFYQKINMLYESSIYITPVIDISPFVISASLKNSKCSPNVFIAMNGCEMFGLRELTEEQKQTLERNHKGLKIEMIYEQPSLLHCLGTGDKDGFKKVVKGVSSISEFCDNVKIRKHLSDDFQRAIVNAIDIEKVISCVPAFNGLRNILMS
jgi:hypothetical protein